MQKKSKIFPNLHKCYYFCVINLNFDINTMEIKKRKSAAEKGRILRETQVIVLYKEVRDKHSREEMSDHLVFENIAEELGIGHSTVRLILKRTGNLYYKKSPKRA